MVGLNPTHTYTKDGVFYYGRKVPKDLSKHYIKDRIVISLRTKSAHKASIASYSITAKLEAYWLNLRLDIMDIPAAHLLAANQTNRTNIITFVQAKDLYTKTKGKGRSRTFFTSAERNSKYLTECLGNKSLDLYKTTDAGAFRDWLFSKSLSVSSVKRILTTVKAIFSLAVREVGLELANPFGSVYLPTKEYTETKRQPLASNTIKKLQAECLQSNDDLRWLVALISDTGMRLSEATGLLVEDICLDSELPYINLKSHDWRSLKTSYSERIIPLAGSSLWAAKRIIANASTEFCFPRYCNRLQCNSNSASAALNKWLKLVAGKEATIHGLRHSLRDRLREVGAPSELIDQIGGWSTQTIGQSYGNGYTLKKLSDWMNRM